MYGDADVDNGNELRRKFPRCTGGSGALGKMAWENGRGPTSVGGAGRPG